MFWPEEVLNVRSLGSQLNARKGLINDFHG